MQVKPLLGGLQLLACRAHHRECLVRLRITMQGTTGKSQVIELSSALQISFYLPRLLLQSRISCCTPTLDEEDETGKLDDALRNAVLYLCFLFWSSVEVLSLSLNDIALAEA